MRLVSLELRDWRAYERCLIEFPDGLIGVGGPNGSGKTTIAEAIGWALFGKLRAGAKVGELRRQGGSGRPSAELIFQLGESVYRVHRVAGGDARLWIGDDGGEPEAIGATNVSRRIVQELDLSWDVFRRTVFAEQKDIAALDPRSTGPQRRAHVERLLGLSRFKRAAEEARSEKRAIENEISGRLAQVEDLAALDAELQEAQTAAERESPVVEKLSRQLDKAEERYRKARKATDELADRARRAEGIERDRKHAVDGLEAARARLKELESGIRERDRQVKRLAKIEGEAGEYPAARRELERFEALGDANDLLEKAGLDLDSVGHDPKAAQRDAERLKNRYSEREKTVSSRDLLANEVNGLQSRLAALRAVSNEGSQDDHRRLVTELKRSLRDVDRQITRVADQLEEDQEHLRAVESGGPETPCPVCGKEYGPDHGVIVDEYRERIATAKDSLPRLKREFASLEKKSSAAEAKLDRAKEAAHELRLTDGPVSIASAERSLAARRARLDKAETTLSAIDEELSPLVERTAAAAGRAEKFTERRAVVEERRRHFDQAAAKLGVKRYVGSEHERARKRAKRLGLLAEEAKELRRQIATATGLEKEQPKVSDQIENCRVNEGAAKAALVELGFKQADFQKQREACDGAEKARDDLKESLQQARLEAQERSQQVKSVKQRIKAARKASTEIDSRRVELRTHAVVADLLDEFRQHEARRAWPRLEEGASALLNAATDGRYADVRLTEHDYRLSIVDRGEQHPLSRFSGGEQDLANLCLRLAIGEWVANERGVDLGVLILDEVFGSQDEDRKQRLLEELRALSQRFRQMLIITHVEEMAEGCESRIDVALASDGSSSATVAV